MATRARADEPDDAAKRRDRFQALVARSPRLPSLGLYSPPQAPRPTLKELGPSPRLLAAAEGGDTDWGAPPRLRWQCS